MDLVRGVDFERPDDMAPGRLECRSPRPLLEFRVHDVLFVLLTVLVFAILAVIAKGAEKL